MRILHLAYEDPRQPASGGGAVRTREIDRRLARRHEVTAIVAGYPGARPRVEDGIRWIPVGPRTGSKVDRLAYFALLAPETLRHPHDLIVEDFSAPFSVGFAPLFSRAPVIASVQWLFARQMRNKYGLPFDWIERSGLRLYDDFIAVSDWLAAELRVRRPGAVLETIPNGVEEQAFALEPGSPRHILFVGRLEIASKGLDLLVGVVSRLAARLREAMPAVIVVGDGPDRSALEKLLVRHGVGRFMELRGRVDGAEKYRLMADAHAVLMPSRWETFGLVAIESQAAGVPVVAFDVGPLREVTGGLGACLVPPFDVDAFTDAVERLITDPARRIELGRSGRQWARRYDWDEIARRQEAHYERALERARSKSARPLASIDR